MNQLLTFLALTTYSTTTTSAWTTNNVPTRTSTIFTSKSSLQSTTSSAADSNVVLRPSDDPELFDSFKVGTARVHRYARENSDESEYIMWYHGRSQNFDSEKKLPPLSTGRIGRATSRNGLHWERELVGSESEDIEGVSLGLNKESWWGFDTAHVGLGQVLLPMSTPAVMTEGGVYLMYYMGGSHEETKIGQYVERELPADMADKMIAGMNMKIGVALSQDGISFGRVEGDDPTGAIMAPYDESDPNMKYMTQLRDEDGSALDLREELYCAWPEVAVNDLSESERTNEQKNMKSFYMFYSTMMKETKEKAIAVAVSDDGFRWFKRGVCVAPEEGTLDAGGCARCTIVRKASYNEDDESWKNENGWIMLYEGVSKDDNKHRIMAAESNDLRKWTKLGVAFDVGSEGAWDADGVGAPHVLRLDDGTSRMYYTGQGENGSTAIGVAKSVGDIEWTREQAQFAFSME